MNEFLLIGGMAFVTYLGRVIVFPISQRMRFPDGLKNALRYVPPVVLSAIIFPSVLIPDGNMLQIGFENAHLIGAVAAIIIGGIYQNLIVTVGVSMGVFFLWRFFVI